MFLIYKQCLKHFQGDFFKIATDFAFALLLPYVNTENTGNIQVLNLPEARYGYHRPTKNVFKIQENDHLCYSSENVIFLLEFQFFCVAS